MTSQSNYTAHRYSNALHLITQLNRYSHSFPRMSARMSNSPAYGKLIHACDLESLRSLKTARLSLPEGPMQPLNLPKVVWEFSSSLKTAGGTSLKLSHEWWRSKSSLFTFTSLTALSSWQSLLVTSSVSSSLRSIDTSGGSELQWVVRKCRSGSIRLAELSAILPLTWTHITSDTFRTVSWAIPFFNPSLKITIAVFFYFISISGRSTFIVTPRQQSIHCTL